MKATSHQTKQAINKHHWLAHVKAQKKSGLNRTEYCKQYRLSYHAMTYWAGKIQTAPEIKTTLVPVPIKRDTRRYSSGTDQVSLRVNLPGKISVEVGDNFSTSTLNRLLGSLGVR